MIQLTTWRNPKTGEAYPVEDLDERYYHPDQDKPPGLGYLFVYGFVAEDRTKPRWGYAGPRGARVPCPEHFQGNATPPPLPQPNPQHCGCTLVRGPNGSMSGSRGSHPATKPIYLCHRMMWSTSPRRSSNHAVRVDPDRPVGVDIARRLRGHGSNGDARCSRRVPCRPRAAIDLDRHHRTRPAR